MASSLLLSYELIALMEWLLTQEESEVKNLIKKALNNGLAGELHKVSTYHNNAQASEALHNTFLDFILNLEELLSECIDENNMSKPLQVHLFAKLQEMNITGVDSQTMWSSIKDTENVITTRQSKEPERSAKPQEERHLLLEKLLENWQPEEQVEVN